MDKLRVFQDTLYVEDEIDEIEKVKKLSRTNIAYESNPLGAEAKAQSPHIKAVVSDYFMKPLNGFQVLEGIRKKRSDLNLTIYTKGTLSKSEHRSCRELNIRVVYKTALTPKSLFSRIDKMLTSDELIEKLSRIKDQTMMMRVNNATMTVGQLLEEIKTGTEIGKEYIKLRLQAKDLTRQKYAS